MNQITIAPVRRSVTVPISAQRAFSLFTEGFHSWWIGHHIGKADLAQAVLEPRVGGRWYEVGVDGSETDWGQVLVCEPPSRLVVTWQLNGKFEYDPDLAHASEVEVNFIADGEQTRVEFEHRYIERLGDGEELVKSVSADGGWSTILGRYVKAATDLAA